MYNKKTRKFQLPPVRVDEDYVKKLGFVCNHLGMSHSDAIREALQEWINNRMFKLKMKRWFVEEE